MRYRLGISVHAREIRALLLRGRDIRWRSCVERGDNASIAESLAAVLSSLPKPMGVRRATVAMGPALCQVRQLDGLPTVSDLSVLTRLVHENSASFFLRVVHRLAISDVERLDDGALWAASFDQDIASTAIEVLEKKGYPKTRIVPSVVALASVIPVGTTVWTDGEYVVEIRVGEHGAMRHVRRIANESVVAERGDESQADAVAYAAALLPSTASFVWHPAPDPKRLARVQRLRVAAAIVLCAGAALAAVAAPGLRAAQIVHRGSSEMNRLRASQTDYARAQGELRRMTLTIDRVEQFREQRGKATVLLGALSQALPESTALVTLRLDSLEGSFVALTPHAADILPQLAAVAEVVAPKIVGSLTKEIAGTAQVERATVRFKRATKPVRRSNATAGKRG